MLLSLMLAAGLTSLLEGPTDEGRWNGLRCLSPTFAALLDYGESSGVVPEVEQAPTLRNGMTGALLQADPDPIVVVRVENPHGFEAPALGGAQELATGIYGRAGVSLRWTVDETMEPDRTLILVLTSSVAVRSAVRSEAMGAAPSPRDGTRGTRAYVFLNKVQSFAARHHLVAMQVLACVLAHEIGHLLLPPNAHWPNSVMQDRWHPSLFLSSSPRLLGFTRDQAKLLRHRARN
jgi:hypothetical protein